MSEAISAAINGHQGDFDLSISSSSIGRLSAYYELVMAHNDLLHLVAPSTDDEFATRHILESLTLLQHLPDRVQFADIGTGAGLPSIPCLLVRDDLRAVLIESKEKKAKFLAIAVEKLGLTDRVRIENRQFTEVDPSGCEYVTCRALDRFAEKLPSMLRWAKRRKLLLFGGDNLRDALNRSQVKFTERLMPLSEKRYLFLT